MKYEFPKNFYWGAATAAHQVEGNNLNDWSQWEQEKEGRPISGRACDHYNRFREDFDIARELGHNAHRFSIEWSRIETEEGKFEIESLRHYGQVIKALRERSIEPFVTLWHWTLPRWLADIGGVENEKFTEYFRRYTEHVVSWFEKTNTRVGFWITINEPEIWTKSAYLDGLWPPQKKSFIKYKRALDALAEAHKRSYQVIRKFQPDAQVGIAKNNVYFEGRGVNKFSKWFKDWWYNEYFLRKIRHHQDFIGLNYYFHNRIKWLFFERNENKWVSDMNWEIFPEGIYHVLMDLRKYNKPIYITENGVADAKDIHREKFFKENLRWIHKALEDGADIRGYLYWAFLDNFEWDKGFWPLFGLVEMDYETMERKIRPSAYDYAKIAQNNGF